MDDNDSQWDTDSEMSESAGAAPASNEGAAEDDLRVPAVPHSAMATLITEISTCCVVSFRVSFCSVCWSFAVFLLIPLIPPWCVLASPHGSSEL